MSQDQDQLTAIWAMLTDIQMPDFPASKMDDPQFKKLYDHIASLRELCLALGKGDLQKHVEGRGFVLSSLKALQSNLRHLTWQTQQIADGDYSQKVEFLGDFSQSFNQMTEKLTKATTQLSDLAHLDPLTQIPNRLALSEFLFAAFPAAAEDGRPLSLFLIDIDHFKKINDTYGHDAGDQALMQIAKILHGQFRDSDLFGRYGGEEFMAVLPNTNSDHALSIGSRILGVIEQTPFIVRGGITLQLTVSIGISSLSADDHSYEEIIRRSDDALYYAKGNGRNCLYIL